MTHIEGTQSRPWIFRLRAGLLLLAALVFFSISSGNFVARQFGLTWIWAAGLAFVFGLLIGYGVSRLTRAMYIGGAAIVTLLTTYLAYDFLRNAVGWSQTTSLLLAAVPFVLMGAAFWDFRRLKAEIRTWADAR
ncbi:hypothetical protein V5F77_09930 [Xanthobacter sp. DSM 24535]|uniref:hypothetical protein n=1 Tax=Roseixanthobacter psychrophilus TaxID=3119917 RepID=UPI003729F924